MDIQQVHTFITQKVVAHQQVTPFLFVGSDIQILAAQIRELAKQLMKEFGVDINYFFEYIGEDELNIKIEDMRDFMSRSYMKSPFDFQVFYIEDISRLTLASANAMLKFLEEPGEGNIIFLSSMSDAGILDTILSRVQLVSLYSTPENQVDLQVYGMMKNYKQQKNPEIFSYYYQLSATKQDARKFLYTLIQFLQDTRYQLEKTPYIVEDITGLERNNFSPKYIIDKYLLEL